MGVRKWVLGLLNKKINLWLMVGCDRHGFEPSTVQKKFQQFKLIKKIEEEKQYPVPTLTMTSPNSRPPSVQGCQKSTFYSGILFPMTLA